MAVYRIVSGDTLSGIALRYNHSVRDLVALNHLGSENRILIGQSLRLSSATLPEAIQLAAMELLRDGVEPVLLPASDASNESVATLP